jgi:hypothetical protein
MSTKSRVPPWDGLTRDQTQFLDSIDRRQLTLSQIEDLGGGASSGDIIAKINEILASHRTK